MTTYKNICNWKDGTTTVVTCAANEPFIPEFGFAMATMKKLYGGRANYLKVIESAQHQKKNTK
jgi:hypothetical protein